MNVKGAGLIAGAILIVGGTWLYWTEIRPTQVRQECAAILLGMDLRGVSTSELKQGVILCVDAGGTDKFLTAIQKSREDGVANSKAAVEASE